MNEQAMKLPEGVEARYAPVAEFRQEDEDGETLVGHAATFDQPYDVGPFREQIAPGAFETSIREDDVRALFNHNENFPLGRTSSGTLELEEDDVGLRTRIDLPESAERVREAIDRGDVDQMSFGFEVLSEEWRELEDGTELRTIKEARLWDVSPVTFPANPNTDVALRSREEWRSEQDEAETRDEGEDVPDGLDEAIRQHVEALKGRNEAMRESLETLNQHRARIVELLPENRQSRPEFDGTEDIEPEWADGAWDRPALRDHPEAGEDDEWDDLSEGDRAAIANRFIVGTADADTYGDLQYPVVNPQTENLNRNGLLAARQRASAEDDTEVASIADALWDELYADEDGNALDTDLLDARLEAAQADVTSEDA